MYNKQVIWKYPFDEQYLPYGLYGVEYTRVLLDIPKINNITYMEYSDTYPNVGNEESNSVTLYTSIPYHRYTLKVFANGTEIPIVNESSVMVKNTFDVNLNDISGKYIYVSYIPGDIKYFLGDHTYDISKNFNVVSGNDYNNDLREIINQSRIYIDNINAILNISPILWIGGFGNREIGKVQPGITPTDVDTHLYTLQNACIDIAKHLSGYSYTNIVLPETIAEYTVKFIESIQRTLTEADEGIYLLSKEGKLNI